MLVTISHTLHIISPVAVVTTGVYYCYCCLHQQRHEKHNHCLLLWLSTAAAISYSTAVFLNRRAAARYR
jgi:hypothetical protein